MIRGAAILFLGGGCLLGAVMLALVTGAQGLTVATIWSALTAFDDQQYAHFIIRHQRVPQIGIAATMGAALAVSGAVLQGVMRNPLASPAILGISSGATLFTVLFGFVMGAPMIWQGPIALLGGLFGFASALGLARLVGGSADPRGLSLILSGALISMLYGALAQSVLLADPELRNAALGWVTGNVNYVYADRLAVMGPVALLAVGGLWAMARPLTLLTLGQDMATAIGIEASRLWWLAAGLVTVAASAAVAICGPVAFVGLVVPHVVRPFVGADLRRAIPANALCGATLLILADLLARTAFAPRVVHTGVVMDLLGGLVFIWLVRRHYLGKRPSEAA